MRTAEYPDPDGDGRGVPASHLLPMKKSARPVLNLLRSHDRVTTSMFLASQSTHRYSARIKELRTLGFVISAERIPHSSAYEFRLLKDPEREALLAARKTAQLEIPEQPSLFDSEGMAA